MKKRLSETAAIYGISQTIVNNRTGNLLRISNQALVYPDIYDTTNGIDRLAETMNAINLYFSQFIHILITL